METNYSAVNAITDSTDEAKKDDVLWYMAKKRAGFKWSLLSYVLVNAMLVTIWYFSSGMYSYFWPIWPMLGWGIGLAAQYFHAYHSEQLFSAEKEYQKLKDQYKN